MFHAQCIINTCKSQLTIKRMLSTHMGKNTSRRQELRNVVGYYKCYIEEQYTQNNTFQVGYHIGILIQCSVVQLYHVTDKQKGERLESQLPICPMITIQSLLTWQKKINGSANLRFFLTNTSILPWWVNNYKVVPFIRIIWRQKISSTNQYICQYNHNKISRIYTTY